MNDILPERILPGRMQYVRPERIQVVDVIPVLDTGRFEQMQRIAVAMASSELIPDTLRRGPVWDEKKGEEVVGWLPRETVVARCFLIVNQAVGWRMDPFAVAQCSSVVHGRVCYEGKLIAAVLDNLLGVQLEYSWNDKPGDALAITVSATDAEGKPIVDSQNRPKIVTGTVGEWKTAHKGSPWFTQPRRQLAYRGAREWARLHRPAIMLGVYTIDELDGAAERQERLGRPEPPIPPPAPPAALEPPQEAKREPVEQPPEPPPPEPPEPPPAPQAFDFDAYRDALKACETIEAMNAAFEKLTRGLPDGDELDECQRILNEMSEPLWTSDE